MRYTSQINDPFGTYTEVIEDEVLAGLLEQHVPVSFQVVEDEWSADYTTRTIRRIASIVRQDM